MLKNSSTRQLRVLREARTEHMSPEEKKFRRQLAQMLIDDGKGHYHAVYARRLMNYNLNLVPIDKSPSTAAISYEDSIVYVNRGLLVAPKMSSDEEQKKMNERILAQLNVLMRHELAHNLMMHQVRMMKHITSIPWSHLKLSCSLHEIENIIEDFEISNTRYTAEDKEIVKKMLLNGKVISGLVTEDHRRAWLDLKLEDMWDAMVQEYDTSGANGSLTDKRSLTLSDANAHLNNIYGNITAEAEADTVQEFKDMLLRQIRQGYKDRKAEIPAEFMKAIDSTANLINQGFKPGDLQNLAREIQGSHGYKPFVVKHPKTKKALYTLYTPEEKGLAQEIIKILLENTPAKADYQRWYDAVTKAIKADTELTPDDIKSILDALN